VTGDPEQHLLRLQHALDLCFSYLARRDRTTAELRRHLEAKRVEPEAIAAALADLEQQGYLDDERYARRFVEDRRALDSWGAERIERRLIAAGVDPQLAAQASAAPHHGEELEAAIGLLRRRLATPPRDDRARSRALGLLVRRGYERELAYDAVRAFERSAA
jgi:regulatory protein